MTRAYYNENDPKTAAWLRELIKAGLIADGEVDTRSIVEVEPSDLAGFVQCHFFAGIGGWSYALRLAGWPDDRAVWTGSCPCQPWSMAGDGKGTDDPRHLWPTWFGLIKERRPAAVFGEQAASLDGLYWLDLVFRDLEAEDYAIAAVDISSACIGAPHIRPRLWIVANTNGAELRGEPRTRPEPLHGEGRRVTGALDHSECERAGRGAGGQGREEYAASAGRQGEGGRLVQALDTGAVDELGNADSAGLQERERIGRVQRAAMESQAREAAERGSALGSVWADADWIHCAPEPGYPAGRWRPVEPGAFPLATGIPARMGRIRGYGNAIVPQVAAEVIAAYMEIATFSSSDVALPAAEEGQ